MTEAEITNKIMDSVYAAREQIYEETKHLLAKEYVAYFSGRAQTTIERNGYRAVRAEDGLGYILQRYV